ncbi:MAG TPA: hypothetical protein VN428_14895 [Bryobacteraceae bacterium]|nr:hypothetical protein [Bryobacteraceae bacterium]
MKMTSFVLIVVTAAFLAPGARADLAAAKAESNLEKRAAKALDNAQAALKTAEQSYDEDADLPKTEAALKEVAESVQFAYDSLLATGKNPSKSPKHFKRAEIKTREMMRRLDDFRAKLGSEERGVVEATRDSVQRVHDSLLEGIMGGGKKK